MHSSHHRGVLSKVTFYLKQVVDSSSLTDSHIRATRKLCFSARKNRYCQSTPHHSSNLAIYLKSILKRPTKYLLDVCCVGPTQSRRIEEHPRGLIETPQLPKNAFVLFMQQNPVQRALRRGVIFPIPTERRGRSVRTQASSFALTDPGSPSQTVVVSKLLLHRRVQHAGGTPENRYCCGDGAAASLRMDPPVSPRESIHTWTSLGPTRRSDNLVPCRSSGSFLGDPITFPGPHAVGPQIQTPKPILSF
jgi:hypothetical protein